MQELQDDVISLADYRHELAIKRWREGKFDEARTLAKEAIEGAEATARRLAYTNTLSIVEQDAGNLPLAIQLINAALPEAMTLKDEDRLAKLHHTQGTNYRRLADAVRAEGERKKKGRDGGRATEDQADVNDALQNALIHFAGAVGFFRELGEVRHVISAMNNSANVLIDLRRTEEALSDLESAVSLNRSLKDRDEEDDIQLLQIYDTRAKAREARATNCAEAGEALGDALRSCAGLFQAAETNFLQTSRKTLARCLARLDFLEESELLQGALDRVGGHPKKAADLLKMNHGSFIRLCDRHPELRRQPKKKPRGRTCKSTAHG